MTDLLSEDELAGLKAMCARTYDGHDMVANANTISRLLSHIDALKAERDGLKEECAKLAEAVQFPEASKCLPTPRRGFELAQMKIAAAIRAKGQL